MSVLSAAVLLASGAIGVGATVGPSASAQAAPFAPTTPTVYITQGSPTQLSEAVQGSSGVQYIPVGSATRTYNAVGFRESDQYLYGLTGALDATPEHLVRIESDGAVTDLGAVAGLADLGAQQYNIGAFVGDTLYVTTYVTVGGSARLFAIDVDAGTATSVTMSSLTTIADFTELDGYLWGLDTSARVVRIDPTTGQTDLFAAPPGIQRPGAGQGFGGAWTYGNGNLGFSDSDSGNVYQLAVTGAATPTPAFALASVIPGPPNTRNDGTASVPIAPADLALSKTVTPAGAELGDTVTYTLTVTNNGPGDSSGFTVNDPIPVGLADVASDECLVDGATVLCVGGELLVGASRTFTLTATLNTTEPSVTNTATVLGNELDPEPANDTSTATVSALTPAISIVKRAGVPVDVNGDGLTNAGDTIQYTFEVTNTGSLALAGVVVNDPKAGAVTCSQSSLAPGESQTCTAAAVYVITPADVSVGAVDNTATASGTTPGGRTVISGPSSTSTPTTAAMPALTILKRSDADTIVSAGQEISYSFVVTNAGNVTIDDIVVEETAFTGAGELSAVECPTGTLVPAEFMTCTADYVVEQADLDTGSLANTAIASGLTPGGEPVPSGPSSVVIPANQSPSLSLFKSADVVAAEAGQTVTYSFLVTNTGNVSITSPTVNEIDFSGTGSLSAIDCPSDVTLAPGDEVTCTATYVVTQADIDAGEITNTATATGTTPGGGTTPPSAPSTEVVTTDPTPAISVEKTADRQQVTEAGQVVTYSFVVANIGNVTLENPTVSEGAFTGRGALSEVSCPDVALAPGESIICTASYSVVAADLVDGGVLSNTATASATPPGGASITSPPSTAVVREVPPVPSAGGLAATGGTIAWSVVGIALLLIAVGGAMFSGRRRNATSTSISG